MTRDEALQVLGLDAGASRAEVSAAHRELAQMLHPDKYAGDKKLHARAEEQMKRVNEARDVLLRGGPAAGRPGSGASADAVEHLSPEERARVRAQAAERARVDISKQVRALDAARGQLRFRLGAGLIAFVLTWRLNGMLGMVASSVSLTVIIWSVTDLWRAGQRIGALKDQLREVVAARDEARRQAKGA